MKRTLLISAALLLLAGAGLLIFLDWAKERPTIHYLSDLRTQVISPPPPSVRHGNLLTIRPQLFPFDYQSPTHLRLVLAAALDAARDAGLLNAQTLVVLPDHIGTWLLATGEKPEFYRARDRLEVRNWLLLGNPLLAMNVLLRNLDANRLDEALLRMKAEQMAADYQSLFGGLAREFGVTLQAGSILLPEPRIDDDGQLHSGSGPLWNLSLVFGPDGRITGEPFLQDWPWTSVRIPTQRVTVADQQYLIERDWLPGWPQSRVQLPNGRTSPPLFLRGRLSWPIGGVPRGVALTPAQAPQLSSLPGTHLLNQWIEP
jgi:hypothetical protein